MKILVTGADGFIGSHLVEQLVKDGHSVRAFTFYNSFNSNGWLDTLDQNITSNIEFFSGDIRDSNGVRKAVKGCDIVFHLAALIAIPFSYHSPDTYVQTNILGTLNVLQAVKEFDIVKMIHTSTSEVYGSAQFVPITESHPTVGQSPYSATKIGADQIAISFYKSFSTPVTIIRPFNTYGPRQSARAIIPTIISQIGKNKLDIKLGSITPTRDFSYVSDTVSGFISAIDANNISGEVINLGSGFEVSMSDTFNYICEIMGSDAKIILANDRLRPEKSEVDRLLSCNLKAKEFLNWKPEYSDISGFKIGLKMTIDWFLDKKNLEHYKANIYNI